MVTLSWWRLARWRRRVTGRAVLAVIVSTHGTTKSKAAHRHLHGDLTRPNHRSSFPLITQSACNRHRIIGFVRVPPGLNSYGIYSSSGHSRCIHSLNPCEFFAHSSPTLQPLPWQNLAKWACESNIDGVNDSSYGSSVSLLGCDGCADGGFRGGSACCLISESLGGSPPLLSSICSVADGGAWVACLTGFAWGVCTTSFAYCPCSAC